MTFNKVRAEGWTMGEPVRAGEVLGVARNDAPKDGMVEVEFARPLDAGVKPIKEISLAIRTGPPGHGGGLRIHGGRPVEHRDAKPLNTFLDRLAAMGSGPSTKRSGLFDDPKPRPRPKPQPSCGQVWKRGRELFEIVEEEPGRGVMGFWRMRRVDDGEERDVNAIDLRDDSWEHVSGGQETAEQAVLRVCKREMARVPVGCDALRWRCIVAAMREEVKARSPEGHACGIKFYCRVARLALEVRFK
jgi:hypothetical protein